LGRWNLGQTLRSSDLGCPLGTFSLLWHLAGAVIGHLSTGTTAHQYPAERKVRENRSNSCGHSELLFVAPSLDLVARDHSILSGLV
jgi:hypothetical protein